MPWLLLRVRTGVQLGLAERELVCARRWFRSRFLRLGRGAGSTGGSTRRGCGIAVNVSATGGVRTGGAGQAAARDADFSEELAGRLDDEARLSEVGEALGALRREEREVIALCVWYGLDYATAARALACRSAPSVRLSRARSKLRSCCRLRGTAGGREQVLSDREKRGPAETGGNDEHRRSSWRGLAELARLLADTAERELPAGRQQVLREHLVSELRLASAPTERPATHPRRKTVIVIAPLAPPPGAAIVLALLPGNHGDLTGATGCWPRSPPSPRDSRATGAQ